MITIKPFLFNKKLLDLKYILFIFAFLLVSILITILSIVYYKNFETIIQNNVRDLSQSVISNDAKELALKFSNIQDTAISISEDFDIAQTIRNGQTKTGFTDLYYLQQKLDKKLAIIAAPNPYISNINILSDDVKVVSDSFPNGFLDVKSIPNQGLYREITGKAKGWISARRKELNAFSDYDENLVSFYKRIYSSQWDGDVIGYVLINVKERYFYDIIKDGIGKYHSDIFIIDHQGKVITDSKQQFLGRDFFQMGLVAKAKLNSPSGSFIERSGSPKFITYYLLDSFDWQIVAVAPLRDLFQDLQTIQKKVLLLGALFLLGSSILVFMIASFVTKPVHRLADIMSNFEQPAPIKEAADFSNEMKVLYASYNRMIQRISDLLDRLRLEENSKREAELISLQAQINPHFLYNTLESINWLALKAQQQEISTMVYKLSRIMRLSLNQGKNFYRLRDELEHVRSYLDIQRIRYSNSFEVREAIPEHLLDYVMLKLVLQPLVENAIIHGFEETSGKGLITITARDCGERICLEVWDDGSGMSREELDRIFDIDFKTKGYGVKNVQQRLQLYCGADYGLRYVSGPGQGTTVEVWIPKQKEEGRPEVEEG